MSELSFEHDGWLASTDLSKLSVGQLQDHIIDGFVYLAALNKRTVAEEVLDCLRGISELRPDQISLAVDFSFPKGGLLDGI